MSKIYSEEDVTWSSIEKYIPYEKVVWGKDKNGISSYKFFDKDDKRINVNDYIQ